jgi:hypothetical protein
MRTLFTFQRLEINSNAGALKELYRHATSDRRFMLLGEGGEGSSRLPSGRFLCWSHPTKDMARRVW